MKLLVLLLMVAFASATVVDIVPCLTAPADKCTIHEINMKPCPKDRKPCSIVLGQDAEITFTYTPHFSASSLKTEAVYQGTKFDALDQDGCKATTCPAENGKMATYNTKMHIGKKLTPGKFTFDWRLYDADNAENMCCFRASVKLKKN